MNACRILYDFMEFNRKSQSSEQIQKENEELFNETRAVFETKYCLPASDFQESLRLDKYGTDQMNKKEDLFSQMRESIERLITKLVHDDRLA